MLLASLNQVKNCLGISLGDSTKDDKITNAMTVAQGLAESFCNRKLGVQSYTKEQHIVVHNVFPFNYPIRSVEAIRRSYSVEIQDTLSTVANYRVYNSFVKLADAKYITMTNRMAYYNNEPSYIEIDYTAGYMPGEEIPLENALAVLSMVCFRDLYQGMIGVKSMDEGDSNIVMEERQYGIPISLLGILSRYKKVKV